MKIDNENKVAKAKPLFVKPELKVLDVKDTQTAALPNTTESPFHFAS